MLRNDNAHRVLMIQPVFCPTQEMLEVNLRSIRSTLDYFYRFPNPLPYYALGGYCKEPRFWQQLEQLIANHRSALDVQVFKYDQNLGKAFVVNDMFDKCKGPEHDYLFSMDSDIIFDTAVADIVSRTIKIFRRYWGFRRLGLIAFDQQGASVHNKTKVKRKRRVANEQLRISRKGHGVAGSCLMMPAKVFEAAGKYRIMGTYGGIDGYLMKDLAAQKFCVAIVESMSVIHPGLQSAGGLKYEKWKKDICKARRATNGSRISMDDLRKIASQTDTLWENEFKDPGTANK